MTEQEFREKMRKGSDETLKPIVEKMTNLVVDAWQSGFNVAMSLVMQPQKEESHDNG